MSKSSFGFWAPIIMVLAGLIPTASLAAPDPSFSCSKRISPDERAICQDPRLTTLDRIANRGYLFLRAKLGKAQANKINLPLIRQRQKCKSDTVCIETAQRESIRVFNQNGAKLEIPDLDREDVNKSATSAVENPPVTSPEPAPSEEPTSSSEAAATPEPAPAVKPTTSSEVAAPPENAPVPTDTKEAAASAAPAPPANIAEAESKPPKTDGEADEPVDRPPVENDEATATNDTAPSGDDAGTAAGTTTPNAQTSREWRPEMEKELRAESELESSATDTLTREMAEADQIRPLSRQERLAVETTRSKHRTAFMLAAILFALVVAYAISKLKRDPGLIAPTAQRTAARVDPPATVQKPEPAPAPPTSAPRPAPPIQPVAQTAPTSAIAPASAPPKAWVWSQYKGRV